MLGSAAQHTAAEGNTWNKSLLLSNDQLPAQLMVVGRMTGRTMDITRNKQLSLGFLQARCGGVLYNASISSMEPLWCQYPNCSRVHRYLNGLNKILLISIPPLLRSRETLFLFIFPTPLANVFKAIQCVLRLCSACLELLNSHNFCYNHIKMFYIQIKVEISYLLQAVS